MCEDLEEWWSYRQVLRRAVCRGRRACAPNVAVQCDGCWFVPFTEHLPGAKRWAGCGACRGEPGRRGAYTLQRRGRQKGLQCSGVNRRGGRLTSPSRHSLWCPGTALSRAQRTIGGSASRMSWPRAMEKLRGTGGQFGSWPVWEYEAFSHNLFCLQTFVLKTRVHCLEF